MMISWESQTCRNLHTSVNSTSHSRTLSLDNYLNSECNIRYFWSACISSHNTSKGKLSQLLQLLVAQYVIVAKITVTVPSFLWSLHKEQCALLQFRGLSCILSMLLLHLYRWQQNLTKKHLLKWYSHSQLWMYHFLWSFLWAADRTQNLHKCFLQSSTPIWQTQAAGVNLQHLLIQQTEVQILD